MQSPVAVAALKLYCEYALARVRGWSGPARVRPPVRADRALCAGRRDDRGADHSQRVLAGHCLQFLASRLRRLAVGVVIATVIDIRTRRIPNALTASMAGVGFGFAATGLSGVSLHGCGRRVRARPGADAARPHARGHRSRRRQVDGRRRGNRRSRTGRQSVSVHGPGGWRARAHRRCATQAAGGYALAGPRG